VQFSGQRPAGLAQPVEYFSHVLLKWNYSPLLANLARNFGGNGRSRIVNLKNQIK
jgi:hypothetical protein